MFFEPSIGYPPRELTWNLKKKDPLEKVKHNYKPKDG